MLRRKPAVRRLTLAEEAGAYDAAQRVVEVHRRLSAWLRAGLMLDEVDRFIAATLDELDCSSCFYGYKIPNLPPFPSFACLSMNACVVHGTAASHRDPLHAGDVLKIDVGVLYRGWIGDAVRTYVFGDVTPEIRRLTDTGKEAIRRGITKLRPGAQLVEWARTVQNYVERERKYHLVTGLGGHGYGRELHTDPYISNVVPDKPRDWPDAYRVLEVGMLLAVEPMIAVGTSQTTQRPGHWPVYSADGSQSVHYEHNVLITGRGPRVLTSGLDDLPDVILR
jgi:methionyl aminopeptidase